MADEPEEIQSTPVEDRIKDLSGKVKTEAEGRTKAEAEATEAKKQVAFANGYIDMLGTYPAAKEFKADIEAKAMSGMSVEDATLAVLGKAGKLGAPTMEPIIPAGGSAGTIIPQSDMPKAINEMSLAEKREALSQLSAQEMFSPFRNN